MARMWTCGFELQSTSAEFGVNSGAIVTGSPAISTTVHRAGTASLRINPSSATSFIEHQITPGVVMRTLHRLYLRVDTLPSTATNIYSMGQSGYFPALLRLQTDGTLVLRDGFTETTLTGTSATLTLGRWYRIELDYTDVSGTLTSGVSAFRGYLDGVQFANALCSNINGFSRIRMGVQLAATTDFYMDDVAVNDTTGSVQTGLPGPGSVVHLRPNAAGDANGWATAVGGTAGAANNYTRVAERTPDDATSYNQTSVSGTTTIDDFNVEDRATAGIGASDTINLVQVGGRVASDNTTAASIVYRLKGQSGGTVQESASTTVANTSWSVHAGQSPRPYMLTAYVNPQGSAVWTPTALDGIQIGVRGDVSQTTVRRVSTLWALVDFQPLTTTALTLSSATEAGQALGRRKARALGIASETGTAQALTRWKALALGVAAEAGAGQTLARAKRKPLPVTAAVTAAQPLGRVKRQTLGIASATETAQALARRKSRAIPAATETSTGQPLAGARRRALTPAAGTDAALVLAKGKRQALLVVAETAAAVPLAPASGLQAADETSTARTLGRVKTTTQGVAGEVGQARPVGRAKTGHLGLPSETTGARPLGGGKARALPPAGEAWTARPLAGRKAWAIPPVAETATARALGVAKTRALGTAVSEDVALPLSGSLAGSVLPAVETTAARPLTGRKTRGLPVAVQSSQAHPLAGTKRTLLGTAASTDTAQPLARGKARALGTGSSVGEALLLGAGRTRLLGVAVETSRALIGPKIRLTPAVEQTLAVALTGVRQRPADDLDASTSGPALTPSTSGPALAASAYGPQLTASTTGG